MIKNEGLGFFYWVRMKFWIFYWKKEHEIRNILKKINEMIVQMHRHVMCRCVSCRILLVWASKEIMVKKWTRKWKFRFIYGWICLLIFCKLQRCQWLNDRKMKREREREKIFEERITLDYVCLWLCLCLYTVCVVCVSNLLILP